jgi:broad specificity phosphatase PhoE
VKDTIRENFPKSTEKEEEIKQRVQKVKHIVKEYIQEHKIEENNQKVVLVAHNGFLSVYTKIADADDKKSHGSVFEN